LWYSVKTIMTFFQDNQTNSIGIQFRFLMTCKLSVDIQKSIDFDGFLDEVGFVRLFIQKYKYYSHQTISHKPLRFCHSLPNPCLPSSCPFQISSSFLFLSVFFKDYFFLFVKFIKSLYIFVIISYFFVPILFSCMISCLFQCHVFCFQFLVFFTDFLFMICCFFCPIFLYAMFFSFQFLVFLAYFSFFDLFNFNRNSLFFLAS